MVKEVVAKTLESLATSAYGIQVIMSPTSSAGTTQANQGTALVVRQLASFPSLYSFAPSGKPSSCNVAYFRCKPRPLILESNGRERLQIKVLERHPYTRQAFFPMGTDANKKAYVVVVADDKGNRLRIRVEI